MNAKDRLLLNFPQRTKWAGNKVSYLTVRCVRNFVDNYHYHNVHALVILSPSSHLSSRTFAVFFFYCIFALFVLVPDFYHHSQADYNVHCATVNLSYVMNINVVGLLGGTQHTSVTWDEGCGGGKGVLPPSLVFAWMFFVPNPGEDMTHLVKIYFPSNNFSHVLSPLCWCMCDER